MKPTVMVAVATLLAVVASSAMAGGKIYRATKPHWWSVDPMKCHAPNDKGAYWCSAGAWQIRKLNGRGADSLAAWGFAGYHPESSEAGFSIWTNFGHQKATFTCSGHDKPLPVGRERKKMQESIPVFSYWVWGSREEVGECLLKPLTMTVDGRAYRLDTKLLRRAVENAIDRASG